MRERERFAQLVALLGRHGMRGLSARLGLSRSDDERLDDARPDAVVAVLRDIGPVGVKFGQILAMRSDLLGPQWIKALETLQDRVPALPFKEIAPAVEEAIGGDINSFFSSFDREPLAAASIAQVHAATLIDGRSVIVKIRRPGIGAIVDADLRLLRRFARTAVKRIPELARLRPDDLLSQFAENLDREMDLSAEGRSSDSIGEFLAPFGVRTASFEWELSGRRVNVQQRLIGIPATDLDRAREAGIDLQAVARTYAQAILRSIIFHGQFHADPHPGNVILFSEGSFGLIDFGAVGRLSPVRRDQLVRLALSIASEDVAGVADILMIWAGDPHVDRARLELALGDLIDNFRNVVLSKVDLSEIFQQVFHLLRQFQLALPPDLALVLRTLLTAEGFVRRMDPTFNIADELAPVATELIAERTSLARLQSEAKKFGIALMNAAANAPDLLKQVERFSRTGSVQIKIADEDRRILLEAIAGSEARNMQIFAAAMLISAAILADSSPAIAICAAAISVTLLFWKRLSK